MAVARARRKSAPSSAHGRRRTRRKRSQRRPFLRRLAAGTVALAAAILIVGQARSLLLSGTPRSLPAPIDAPMRYTVVSGDTVSSVAYAFATDPREVLHETGAASIDAPLPPGSSLTVNASRLWTRIHRPPLAANESLIEAAARRFQVEPALALAVAWQESRLDQTARSSTGAVGVMQVEPDTSSLASRDLGIAIDPRRVAENIVAGVFWIHSLLSSYGGDRAAALAAYYEGPGNLARRGYLPGTAEYVARAQQLRQALLAANPGLSS